MIGPLAYVGGKRRLAPRLIPLIPPHLTYVEPFAGGAQLFFHKSPSPVEVLNDLDLEIVTFLRVCQHHPDELIRWLRSTVSSRQLHEWFTQTDPAVLTDVQRAARFLYLQKNSFGGRVTRQSFNYAVTKKAGYQPLRLPKILHAASERLAGVKLERLSYEQVLQRYDRPTTFFYLDPPYVGRMLYRWNFTEADFALLAKRLRQLKGRFLLSINDHLVSRRVFQGFSCQPISLAYTASRRVPTVTELLYANYPLRESLHPSLPGQPVSRRGTDSNRRPDESMRPEPAERAVSAASS